MPEVNRLAAFSRASNRLKTVTRQHLGIKTVGQKRCYFEKQTGEVIENKWKGYMDSRKQTGKQSGEVVENT